jgi:hypothetical protein
MILGSASMSRGEFFAGLFILGCINGLGSRVIGSVSSSGWNDAILQTFGISVIIWIACVAGAALIFQREETATDIVRFADVVFAAGFLLLVALPSGSLSWLAVTALSLYIIPSAESSSSRRRGAMILLATTVPMLWSPLLQLFFAEFILQIDASLVGLLLGTEQTGNTVRFSDNSGSLVILPYCSSLANVSLAFLTWVTISRWLCHRWSAEDLCWCLLACVSVVAVNVTRMSLMGFSVRHYELIHSPLADTITTVLILSITIGIALLGVRRELLSRI